MDGNGRWAKKAGALRVFGHQQGVESVRAAVEGSVELGVKHLTLYAFSTENWNRPKLEVMALMKLLVNSITKEAPKLHKQNIRITAIGHLDQLPDDARKGLEKGIELTKDNTGLNLQLALSYSGKWDIAQAAKRLAERVAKGELSPEDINEDTFANHLSTAGQPDPELMIRTSGELRISNFLLWQLAYSELYITDKLWPEFGKEDFFEAIYSYQNRERRFGKTSEQVK